MYLLFFLFACMHLNMCIHTNRYTCMYTAIKNYKHCYFHVILVINVCKYIHTVKNSSAPLWYNFYCARQTKLHQLKLMHKTAPSKHSQCDTVNAVDTLCLLVVCTNGNTWFRSPRSGCVFITIEAVTLFLASYFQSLPTSKDFIDWMLGHRFLFWLSIETFILNVLHLQFFVQAVSVVHWLTITHNVHKTDDKLIYF